MKTFLLLLSLFFTLNQGFAQKSPAIFHGNYAKLIPSAGLEFNDAKFILSSSVDPTAVAVDAPTGSLLMNGSGLYRKADNGLTTNWSAFSAGSGLTSLNSLVGSSQTFAIGTAGTAPDFVSAGSTHTLDIPMAATASVTAGLVSKAQYDTLNAKEPAITATTAADVYLGDKAFHTLNTALVPELTNLYWTTARFDTQLATKTTANLTEGANLYYTTARWDTQLATKTTTNLTEGSNLYWTTARFDTQLATKTTTNLTEGANLYYTTTRFDTALATKTTTNLTEGSNLYYTDARAIDAPLTGYAAAPGTVSSTDTILEAIQKIDANQSGSTISQELMDADSTTTYVLDQAGNEYSRFEGVANAYISFSTSDTTNDISGAAFSSNMENLYITTTGGLHAYIKNGNTYAPLKLNIGAANYGGVAVEYDGDHFTAGKTASPYYELFSKTLYVFSILTTPLNTAPNGAVNGVAYNSDASKLLLGGAGSPYVNFYTMTSDGAVGTKDSDPGTLPAGTVNGVCFSTDGYASVANTTTPFGRNYWIAGPYTNIAFTGGAPAGNGAACAYSPNNQYVAFVHLSGNNLTIYEKTGSGGSAVYTLVAGTPAMVGSCTALGQCGVSWSADGLTLYASGATVPNVEAFSVNYTTDTFTSLTDAFGILSADVGSVSTVVTSPDGQFLFAGAFTTGYNTDRNILFRVPTAPAVNIRTNTY